MDEYTDIEICEVIDMAVESALQVCAFKYILIILFYSL